MSNKLLLEALKSIFYDYRRGYVDENQDNLKRNLTRVYGKIRTDWRQ